MAASNGEFQLTHTSISITGINDPVLFTNLTIRQLLVDTGSGSFSWRRDGHTTLQDHISFYQETMGRQIDITIQDDFRFSGFITSIYLHNEDEEASEYMISFEGMPGRINQFHECNSWYKKTFGAIIKELVPTNTPSVKVPVQDSETLFYTVQYNQTHFEFLSMMATRLGFWMYYDGKDLLFDPPSGPPVTLMKDKDLQHISLYSVASKPHETISGFDTYKGAATSNQQKTPSATGMIGVASDAGQAVYGNNQTSRHIAHAANESVLKQMNMLQQQQSLSAAVILQGNSHTSTLNIGKKIKVLEASNASAGEYIITSITHSCPTADSYNNYINFIPAEITYPPYTDALAFPYCEAQPAIVVENEDKDGNDRIKVRFPWMKATETSPWLSIVTPYAGKNKGMRFIPEKNEEVMVDFISQHAERPYVTGTIFTGGKKSGIPAGHCVKSIGTGSGRRFEIDDCNGILRIYDNYTNKVPKNGMLMTRKDEDTKILIESQKADQDYTVISLNNEEYLNLGVVSGGSLIAEIRMEKEGRKITVKSEGSIDFSSGTINMNAEKINIKANKELNMEGTQTGTTVKGKAINIEGTTDSTIKGVNITIDASAQLDLKGGALANLTAALVKIN